MSNDCEYTLCAVGPKESLERLFQIMNYKDDTFVLHRVKGAYGGTVGLLLNDNDTDVYETQIYGDVAWATNKLADNGPMEIVWEQGYEGKLATNLRFLSDLLHINMEWYSYEPGVGFSEHYVIIDGDIKVNEAVNYGNWSSISEDDEFENTVKGIHSLLKENDIPIKEIDEAIYLFAEACETNSEVNMEVGGFIEDFSPCDLVKGIYGPGKRQTIDFMD